jgi:hypothetical protein
MIVIIRSPLFEGFKNSEIVQKYTQKPRKNSTEFTRKTQFEYFMTTSLEVWTSNIRVRGRGPSLDVHEEHFAIRCRRQEPELLLKSLYFRAVGKQNRMTPNDRTPVGRFRLITLIFRTEARRRSTSWTFKKPFLDLACASQSHIRGVMHDLFFSEV